ncbi:LysR family transcriptional regulator [Roseobacter denitrificans]|uniref:Transcriptional regulator, LysR family, putative n=1 Tax=Roseobacter denitrificans (strain ATCC 33942 / OCh 114) TaxID=375451 RepID=Q16BZ6_ROSDO|nr:LysR substrate-binding domain-containing protein [Roseobacter denitrificans]ABG30497.1 transcriptional regulator, LysR family, putative [Roseobacter denitrificans OCh 114]AVL53651.1 LysR family transcriptional regulator [Roseobacter denitrificans]SFF73492.1 transcriptional regulator, LysR family [Roseobacter denitrificans OCh 114]
MRLEWIDDILAVLDTGSLARAAQKRLVTQSAFTRRVRLIEESIGAELFDRRRRPVMLLAGVEALAPELRDLSTRLRQVRQKLHAANSQTGSALSFACQHAITTTVSPYIVRALTARGDAPVRVRSCNQEECLVLLLSGEVDFVLTYTVPETPTPFLEGAFESLKLGDDVLIPVCAPGLRDDISSDRLPVISYPSDVFLGQVFDRHIVPRLDNEVQVVTKTETALTLAAYEFAVGGIGVAWLPQSMVVTALAQGSLISLDRDLPVQPLHIKAFRLCDDGGLQSDSAWRNTLSQIALPDHLQSHAPRGADGYPFAGGSYPSCPSAQS